MVAIVTIELTSYWRAGTGRGSAGRLDALCLRDRDGLPYLPGRTLKGLLRDAVDRAEQWGWFDDLSPSGEDSSGTLVQRLFGQAGFHRSDAAGEGSLTPIRNTRSGTLAIANATLPETDRRALASAEAVWRRRLFEVVNTTAMDPETGTALDKTLRAEEVALPMTLEAHVSPLAGAPETWREVLDRALPLVRGLGSGRSRGFGQCRLTLVDAAEGAVA
jgi:CRISPR/Cas system CSM-associated protein Csm3 (group 7 of RAMP superfamily)